MIFDSRRMVREIGGTYGTGISASAGTSNLGIAE